MDLLCSDRSTLLYETNPKRGVTPCLPPDLASLISIALEGKLFLQLQFLIVGLVTCSLAFHVPQGLDPLRDLGEQPFLKESPCKVIPEALIEVGNK